MHPLLLGWRRMVLFAVACWDVGIGLALMMRLIDGRPWLQAFAFAIPVAFLFGFVCLSAWWVCRSAPLATTPHTQLAGRLLGGTVQAAAVGAVLALLWEVFLSRTFGFGPSRLGRFLDFGIMAAAMLFLYPVSIVVHYLVLAFEQARAAERGALESRVAARDSELRALRAQLNPHFLFNSLNSINALIGGDPEGARRMCESLGDFLRRTLNLGARDTVPLADELALVDRYLGIERVRFGERLVVDRDIDPEAARCLVPPLLLQPLVENAIKHGVADRVEGGIVRIVAHRAEDRLTIEVVNGIDPEAPPRRGEGHGLDNVRRRLDAFSAREARLDVRHDAERFRVTLTLPALEPERAAAPAGGFARA
jgi:two-component system sensor histidine kinase AlgZ